MRALLSSTPAHGHLQPMLPLGRAVRAAGHEVAVATAPQLCARATVRAEVGRLLDEPCYRDAAAEVAAEIAAMPDAAAAVGLLESLSRG